MYGFDQGVIRTGTNCVKWDGMEGKFGSSSPLPMWIADMDFPVAPQIEESIVGRAAHPVYGYTCVDANFYTDFCRWVEKRSGWSLEQSWLELSPGVVPAIAISILAFTQPRDQVLIQSPVYFPFAGTIEGLGRQVCDNPLICEQGRYAIDFVDLERKAARPEVTMMLLCSPHNPVGRVFSQEEIRHVGEICLRNRVWLFSDEIHSDIIMAGHTHTPAASLGGEFAQNTITAMAPSKTFNIAGLQVSAIVIPNPELRGRFAAQRDSLHISSINPFAAVAFPAAYQAALESDYVARLNAYIWENYNYLKESLDAGSCRLTLSPLEGTYLAWLDASALGMDDEALNSFFLSRADLACNPGVEFGPGGRGHLRLNLACPRQYLARAAAQLAAALDHL